MDKPFLLIAGETYYPSSGTGDWIGTFSSYEEALATVNESKGGYYPYLINGIDYDWYEIVNLEKWVN